jgi:hypothetical protein
MNAMKLHTLSKAILIGLAAGVGFAADVQALNLSPHGVGQVLVYPYYTVNAGNQTLISVVNSTAAGKAVRIRFREGRNSRAVLNFQLYLSPFDVWTAALFSLSDTGPNNPANLITTDNSCTVPRINGNTSLPALVNGNRYAPFLNYGYTASEPDAGPDSLDRTREGHFEMIEMGEVVDRESTSLSAIKQGSNGVPANCLQVLQAWLPTGSAGSTNNYWTVNALVDIAPPQGGLFGAAAIVDALAGTMMSYRADAIEAFSDIAQHVRPGESQPSLASARSNAQTAVAQVFSDGAVVTASYPLAQAIDAVSALFVQDEIFNQFVTSASVGGASEWVVTFPTKYAYTDPLVSSSQFVAIAPFTNVFPLVSTSGNTGIAAVDVAFSIFNREAQDPDFQYPCSTHPNDPNCSPFPIPAPPALFPEQLLWATNVISFNQANTGISGSAILGSRLALNVEAGFAGMFDGWLGLRLYASPSTPPNRMDQHRMRPDQAGGQWLGLPVAGFWAASYTNGQLTPGVLSNYAALTMHSGSNRFEPAPAP